MIITSRASAEAEDLWWSAPRGCPQRAEVRRLVAQMLGANKRLPDDLRIVGRLQQTAGKGREQRFRLVLTLDAPDAQGQRELTGANCKDLSQAAAWLIALAVDPSLGSEDPKSNPAEQDAAPPAQKTTGSTRPGAPESVSGVGRTAPATPERDFPDTNAPDERRRPIEEPSPKAERTEKVEEHSEHPPDEANTRPRRPRAAHRGRPRWGLVALHTGVWSAGLPKPQAVLAGSGGIGWDRLYIETRYDIAFKRSLELGLSGSTEFSSQGLSLLTCGQWGTERFRGGPCVVVNGVRTTGRAMRISEPSRDTQYWAQAGLAALIGWQALPPLEFSLELGTSLAVSRRPQFLIEGLGEVTRAHFATAYALFGVGLRIR